MTDRQKYLVLITGFGLGWTETIDKETGAFTIWHEVGEDKVTGYGGFTAGYTFNPDGSFKELHIVE